MRIKVTAKIEYEVQLDASPDDNGIIQNERQVIEDASSELEVEEFKIIDIEIKKL